jgi:hypothetical protein
VQDAISKIYSNINYYITKTIFEDNLSNKAFRDVISSGDIKYLLLKYEEKIRMLSQPKEPLLIDKKDIFSQKIEIEHILPNNNKKSEDFNSKYLNNLGNLALASKPANGSMSNKPFRQKVKNYYSKSVFRMQQELVNYRRWDKKEIKDRQSKIVKFAKAAWSIPYDKS